MKHAFRILLLLLISHQITAQHIYQIRADSVRIYNVCDTAELIIENRTRGVAGFLFNKGNGRTEFRRLTLEMVGSNQIAIAGQDTLDISTLPGIGGVDTIYRDGDYIKYLKKGVTYPLYAPQPVFYVIPEGHSGYEPEQFVTNQVAGFDAYDAADMPLTSDQALNDPAPPTRLFYTGHTIRYGPRGYQMAVNWDGELTGPRGVFVRNKDDTQGTWGAWRELMFKDYADNKFALKAHTHHSDYYTISQLQAPGQSQVHWGNITGAPSFSNYYTAGNLQTPGQSQVHWNNIIGAPNFTVNETLQTVTDRGSTTTNIIKAPSLGLHGGNGNGLRFWDGNSNYSIYMSDASDASYGGRVNNAGSSPNDYNMYFRMTENNRGFVFVPGSQVPTVQIDNQGISNTGWFRSMGNTGWVSQSYGGGWYMVDNEWIRSYGARSIYHDQGILRTDGTFQVGGGGAKMNVPSTGIPTIDGNAIWHAGNDGSGSGLDADLLDGKHAHDIIGNWGQITSHAGLSDFNGISRFGSTFINGNGAPPANGPGNGSLAQYYSWAHSLGAEYPVENYHLQLTMGRPGGGGSESAPYLYRRFKELTHYTDWQKIAAGHADNAGALNGIESSRFIYGENGTGSLNISSANLDEVYKSGFYNGYGMYNAPSPDWYNVIHSEHTNPNGTYSNQIAQRFTGSLKEVHVFLRTQYNNEWGDWREIWHTGNLAVSVTGDANKVAQRDGSGNLHATGFYQSSHSSLKHNIRNFTGAALPLINNLEIKEFVYKNDSTNSLHFGILADSTDWHFATKKHDRFDTNSSLAISLKAIQELSKENEQLREQVKTLEERMKRLEQLFDKKQ